MSDFKPMGWKVQYQPVGGDYLTTYRQPLLYDATVQFGEGHGPIHGFFLQGARDIDHSAQEVIFRQVSRQRKRISTLCP